MFLLKNQFDCVAGLSGSLVFSLGVFIISLLLLHDNALSAEHNTATPVLSVRPAITFS